MVLELRRCSTWKFHSRYFGLRNWLATSFRFGGAHPGGARARKLPTVPPALKLDWNAELQNAIRDAALFGLAGETAPVVVSEKDVTTGKFPGYRFRRGPGYRSLESPNPPGDAV